MSRPRTAGITRTVSYILNLSKQPTPAPSPPRDGDYEQDHGVENTDMALDNNELPVRHLYILSFLSSKILYSLWTMLRSFLSQLP